MSYALHDIRNCQVIHLLSRIKYGSLLVLDDAVRWRWSLLMPWLIYVVIGLLLYIVGDGSAPSAGGLLALCTTVTFITVVITSGHRISDTNRSASRYSAVQCEVHSAVVQCL